MTDYTEPRTVTDDTPPTVMQIFQSVLENYANSNFWFSQPVEGWADNPENVDEILSAAHTLRDELKIAGILPPQRWTLGDEFEMYERLKSGRVTILLPPQ